MRKQPLAAALAATVLGLTLGSCADDQAEPAASDVDRTPTSTSESAPSPSSPGASTSAPAQSVPASPSASALATPTTTPTSGQSSASGSGGDGQAGSPDIASMLLPASRMGKLNEQWTWAAGSDFGTEPANLTACHKVELQVIGADDVAVREYTSRLDATVRAYHLVASFADDVTARRAYAVLQSWRDDCRRRLEQRDRGADGVQVTPAEPVRSLAEAASSYVVFAPTATGSARIDNVASALRGSVVDVVVVRLEGNDFNYPRGGTPAAVGVRTAAERSG